MTCPACSFGNERGALYCRNCRTLFLGDIETDGVPDENERILVLCQACELMRSGQWSLAEFRQYLAEFTAEQQRREEGIRGVDIPFGLEDEFQEEVEVGLNGVEACNLGLEALGAYDPEVDGDHVVTEALQAFYRGVVRVKEAMKINRRSYGRPLWL